MNAAVSGTSVLGQGAPLEDRKRRLGEGATLLATPPEAASLPQSDRRRVITFGAVMAFGVLLIGLGWLGASRTVLVTEQIPYLISGGLLGLGCTVAGGLGYFAHWITVSRREAADRDQRAEQRHRELLGALEALAARPTGGDPSDVAASNGAERPLRRAPRRS